MPKYPYYIVPDIEALGKESDPQTLNLHRRRIAANIGDPDALRAILGDASCDFHDFYGTSDLPNLSTEDTIDSFLERFGNDVASLPGQDDGVVPVVPAAPAVRDLDYASRMERELQESDIPEAADADATLGAIDAFLSNNPPQRIRPKKESKEPEMPSLTESFAKILIKNGNYSRALEIITQISLNNPEKSIYFADQIRFLKKVILIQGR